jgi:hypothetical protein
MRLTESTGRDGWHMKLANQTRTSGLPRVVQPCWGTRFSTFPLKPELGVSCFWRLLIFEG